MELSGIIMEINELREFDPLWPRTGPARNLEALFLFFLVQFSPIHPNQSNFWGPVRLEWTTSLSTVGISKGRKPGEVRSAAVPGCGFEHRPGTPSED
jgi:hypothetical protein